MACTVALLGVGLVMVYSASLDVTTAGFDATTYDAQLSVAGLLGSWVNKNLIYAVLAVGAMLLGSRVDLYAIFRARGWFNPVWGAILVSFGLCAMTLVPGFGKSVNGASRWLYIGPPGMGISFQPSELMKWTLVVALAWWCSRRRGVMHRFFHGLLPGLLLVGLACGLIVIEDLGTAVLIGAVAVVMLVAGGARLWKLGMILPLGLAGVVAAIVQSPYRVKRLTAFLDPSLRQQLVAEHALSSGHYAAWPS